MVPDDAYKRCTAVKVHKTQYIIYTLEESGLTPNSFCGLINRLLCNAFHKFMHKILSKIGNSWLW